MKYKLFLIFLLFLLKSFSCDMIFDSCLKAYSDIQKNENFQDKKFSNIQKNENFQDKKFSKKGFIEDLEGFIEDLEGFNFQEEYFPKARFKKDKFKKNKKFILSVQAEIKKNLNSENTNNKNIDIKKISFEENSKKNIYENNKTKIKFKFNFYSNFLKLILFFLNKFTNPVFYYFIFKSVYYLF